MTIDGFHLYRIKIDVYDLLAGMRRRAGHSVTDGSRLCL